MVFYWTKAAVSIVAVSLLVWHMRAVKHQTLTLGRWLRYQSLLFFSVLIAGTSVDQAAHGAPITWYTVGALVGMVLVCVAVGISISEEVGKPRTISRRGRS